MRFIKKLIAQLIAKIMAINVLYFGGTAPISSSGGGSVQTIVKRGVLHTSTRTVNREGVDVTYYFNKATFAEGIPADYQLYYNGQWYAKGQMEEFIDEIILGNNTVLNFPANLIWQPNDILEMKYQIIVP